MLSTKVGKEAYVEPIIEGGSYQLVVKIGKPHDAEMAKNGTKLARGANFKCVMSDALINDLHLVADTHLAEELLRLVVWEPDAAV